MLRQTSLFLIFLFLGSCAKEDGVSNVIQLSQITVGSTELSLEDADNTGLPLDRTISLIFSGAINSNMASDAVLLKHGSENIDIVFAFSSDNRTISINPAQILKSNTRYTLIVTEQLRGSKGERVIAKEVSFTTVLGGMTITSVKANDREIKDENKIIDVPVNLRLSIQFSNPIDESSIQDGIDLKGAGVSPVQLSLENDNKTLLISTASQLLQFSQYQISISPSLRGVNSEVFTGFSKTFYTGKDPNPKFPVISDEALLTLVQKQTFKYFWDFAQSASGMARDRNTSGDLVTTGGSGFGLMAIITGIERDFITRQEGVERLAKILSFLEKADRFHGAWPHWINGNTGKTIPFSSNDNGGDLVETSFLIQGLLTFRQYLNNTDETEKLLIDRINNLWETVEWDWYTRGGQQVLYWHWSPDKDWVMNHQIRGYDEALVTYFLAAASPTHAIDGAVYHKGWAKDGSIKNSRSFYNITLPLGEDYGGPLFFTHYSFLGIDPRNLRDTYANYWEQNVSHSLINQAYAIANPKAFLGYSEENWGLTASDNQSGYCAHSPTNDLGVIAPTAALSSFPYTPEQSTKALKFFYYNLGDRLWGEYGFYDAFNLSEGWVANSYLAIDQGPIIVMIENYRSGLLWDLFMSAPEVKVAKEKLDFTN